MSDLKTQLREYTEANVERIDVDDVAAVVCSQVSGEGRRVWHLRPAAAFTFAVLTVLVSVGSTAWLLDGRSGDLADPPASVTNQIHHLLETYHRAWNEPDRALFLEVVTDDYIMHTELYGDWSAYMQSNALVESFHSVNGTPIIAGEGPWYASQVSFVTGTSGAFTPEGVEGISTFKIVEVDGELKIARHTFSADYYETD